MSDILPNKPNITDHLCPGVIAIEAAHAIARTHETDPATLAGMEGSLDSAVEVFNNVRSQAMLAGFACRQAATNSNGELTCPLGDTVRDTNHLLSTLQPLAPQEAGGITYGYL